MDAKVGITKRNHFLSRSQILSAAGLASMKEVVVPFFSFHRSQSGKGVDQTFDLLKAFIDLQVEYIPSRTKVGDWTVPDQWDFRSATISDGNGKTIVDASQSNLHVYNGSISVDQQMDFHQLKSRLSVHSKLEDAIEYRTAFFQDDWGFCVSKAQWHELESSRGKLSVRIDADYRPGSLPIAQSFLPGESKREVLIWVHTCHPSLADDNLSSLAVAVGLNRWLRNLNDRQFGYRFVFGPATIGPIAWWHQRKSGEDTGSLDPIEMGLVLALLGNGEKIHYKLSESGTSFFDRWFGRQANVTCLPFQPWGYDERQWNSPGIGIPTGRVSRNLPGQFDQYHSSEDNLDFLIEERMQSSLEKIAEAISALETNIVPKNKFPAGEPQLGKRDLYRAYGQNQVDPELQQAILWTLNQADGCRDLLDIADRSGLDFRRIVNAFDVLLHHQLVKIGCQKATK